MPSPINFRSFLREEKKKDKKEINQRITQATRLKKSEEQFIIFLSSIVRSRVTTKFPASKRAFDENGLRLYVALPIVPSASSVQTLHIAATIRSTKMYFLVGRSSVFPNFVFPRLFATRNRVFISRSRNESPAGFVVVNPPVCQVWNRDVVKIEKFDWIIVRSIRKIIRET